MQYKLQNCFKCVGEAALRRLKPFATVSVIAACVGYANEADAMMETVKYLFKYAFSKTEELTRLRDSVDGTEIDATYKAYEAGRSEKNPEKAYQLFRIALGGIGTSEYSKKFNAIVDNNIKRFCEDDELFVGAFYAVKDKLLKQKIDLEVIKNKSIVSCFQSLSTASSKLATLQESAGDVEKAINLQKQAVFWFFLYAKDDSALDKYLCIEIEKLKMLSVKR